MVLHYGFECRTFSVLSRKHIKIQLKPVARGVRPLPNVSLFPLTPTGTDVKEAQVICVSTGTKCINGEYMSDRGLALNDCHAEIIARRSLIRYLYTQLEFFLRSVDGVKLVFFKPLSMFCLLCW